MNGNITLHECDGRIVSVYLPVTAQKSDGLPVVYALDGDKFFKNAYKIFQGESFPRCIVIGVPPINRLDEYTPWYLESINPKFPPFGGKAKEHLAFLAGTLKVWVDATFPSAPGFDRTFLLGNSLGGLFSAFSLYHDATFGNIISISGSFWYPGWLEYIESASVLNTLANVHMVSGKNEGAGALDARSNAVTNTEKTFSTFLERLGKSKASIEWDDGGHHDNVDVRYQKAFRWIQDNI